jgi:hypothetical protein
LTCSNADLQALHQKYFYRSGKNPPVPHWSLFSVLDVTAPLSILVENSLSNESSQNPPHLLGALIEPFRETTFTANFTYRSGERVQFMWLIDGVRLEGPSVRFTSTRIGWINVSVVVLESGQPLIRLNERMLSKYVRREFSSMSENEKQVSLQAMKNIFDYTTHEGQETFGSSNFKDIAYFVSKHLQGSIFC